MDNLTKMEHESCSNFTEVSKHLTVFDTLNKTANNLLGAIKDENDPETRLDLCNALQETEDKI